MVASWYDDWAWWGIAASKAFDPDYEEIFGQRLGFFQSVAIDMWDLIDDGGFKAVADSIPDEVWAQSSAGFTRKVLTDRCERHKGTRNAWNLILQGRTRQPAPERRLRGLHGSGEC